jgi:hypothetical protein
LENGKQKATADSKSRLKVVASSMQGSTTKVKSRTGIYMDYSYAKLVCSAGKHGKKERASHLLFACARCMEEYAPAPFFESEPHSKAESQT